MGCFRLFCGSKFVLYPLLIRSSIFFYSATLKNKDLKKSCIFVLISLRTDSSFCCNSANFSTSWSFLHLTGLDFIHIFPVIQWLVKQAMETREEQGDRIRSYSISQFHKNHEMPSDVERNQKLPACVSAVKTFQETYAAKRKYKKPDSVLIITLSFL